jgi:hypothetical protein
VRWLFWWRPPCLLRRVTVNFTHDPTEALEGVLWRSRGPWLTLTQVIAIKAQHEPVSLPGEVVVHRDRISFMQVAPP